MSRRRELEAAYECARCFAAIAKGATLCDQCGELYSAQPSPEGQEGWRRRAWEDRDRTDDGRFVAGAPQPVRLSDEVDEVEVERLPTGITAIDLVTGGGFARGYSYALKGPGGTGKSRVALASAAALCRFGPVVYACASAEDTKEDVRRYAKAAGYLERRAVAEQLHCIDREDSPDAMVDAIASVEPVFVVVDAVSALDDLQYGARLLREYGKASGATILGLHHERSDGVMVGGLKLPYLVDAILEIDAMVREFGAWQPTTEPSSYARLRTGKNRFAEQGCFAILQLTGRGFDVLETHALPSSKEVAA